MAIRGQNSEGFVLVSILILIALISAVVVGIMSSINLQNVLQARLTERWQIQQALNWSMVKIQNHLPPNIPDRCAGHLCTEKDLIAQEDWMSLPLPSAFKPMTCSYVVNQFEIDSQTVSQVLVRVKRHKREIYQIKTID